MATLLSPQPLPAGNIKVNRLKTDSVPECSSEHPMDLQNGKGKRGQGDRLKPEHLDTLICSTVPLGGLSLYAPTFLLPALAMSPALPPPVRQD